MLRSLKNTLDFGFRQLVRFPGPPIRSASQDHVRLADEVGVFLSGFEGALERLTAANLSPVIADIGAKNFFLAGVLNSIFSKFGCVPEVHGIEIDSFRRYSNLRTRAQYGDYYASQIPKGAFHPIDFLDFQTKLDFAFLLNPFVTPHPHLAWGLPGGKFRPASFFEHLTELLIPRKGALVLSSPNEQELETALEFSKRHGFREVQRHSWFPGQDSLQRQPRLGALLSLS